MAGGVKKQLQTTSIEKNISVTLFRTFANSWNIKFCVALIHGLFGCFISWGEESEGAKLKRHLRLFHLWCYVEWRVLSFPIMYVHFQ